MDGSLGRGRVAAAIAADVATPAFLSQTVAVSTATIIGDGGSCSPSVAGDGSVTILWRCRGGRSRPRDVPGGSASPSGPPTWTCASGSTVGGITLAGTVNAVDPLEPFRFGTCVAASSLSLHVGPDPVRGADVV